jgi:hypothetical protein
VRGRAQLFFAAFALGALDDLDAREALDGAGASLRSRRTMLVTNFLIPA